VKMSSSWGRRSGQPPSVPIPLRGAALNATIWWLCSRWRKVFSVGS